MKKLMCVILMMVFLSVAEAGYVDVDTYLNGSIYQPSMEAMPGDSIYLEVYLPNAIGSKPQVPFTNILNVSCANFPVEQAVFPTPIGLHPWSGSVSPDGQGGINIVMNGGPLEIGNPHPGVIARVTFTVPNELPTNGKIIVDALAGTGDWFARWIPYDGQYDSLPYQEILVIPEPCTLSLMGVGLLALRKRKS